MDKYKPLMTKKEIEKRRDWQEKVYQKLKSINKKCRVKVLNKEIIVIPEVFSPIFPDSVLLARTVRKVIKKGETVLDMGTSTGVQAIFAADKAKKVLAADINTEAIKCAKINIKNQKLNNKIKVLKSDLFSKVRGKYDSVIFNPPFRWFKPRDMLERGELDENYKTLTKFFSQVKKYLKKGGKIILAFSNNGDLEYLKLLIKKSGFKSKIIAKQKPNRWYYYIFEIIKK